MNRKPRSLAFYIYTGSALFHVALGLGALALPRSHRNEIVAIQLAEAKKKKDPPKPAPVPPPPPPEDKPKPKAAPAHQAQAKVAPETKAPEAAPPPAVPMGADGFADLGIALGNADGPGIAIPGAVAAAAGAGPVGPKATATPKHRVEQLAPAQGAEACTEPVIRPKRKVPVAPKYTMQARQAEIEGVVRIEVTVDEGGRVLSARVLSGLGYGLDEAAIAAAKATIFEPATRCGKPVVGTAVLPFRFEQT